MAEKIEPLKPEVAAQLPREVCPKCKRSVLVEIVKVETKKDDGTVEVSEKRELRPHHPGKEHPGFKGSSRQVRKDSVCT